MNALKGFLRTPPTGQNRNRNRPKKFAMSNKGMQNYYKGKGVGLQGALTKKGRFIATLKTKEAIDLMIPDLRNFTVCAFW